MSEDLKKNKEITEWVNIYTEDLFRYAIKKMPDQDSASDMVQNTFLAAISSYNNFKRESKPKTWLMSILKNKVMDHYRLMYKRNESTFEPELEMFDQNGGWLQNQIPSDWSGETHLLDNHEFNNVFKGCLDNLPEHWHGAIQMKYLDSSIKPEEVGISQTNYWKMLERARKQLRKCLDQNWFVQGK